MRILYVVPFVPRGEAAHGGRVVAETMRRTASAHEVCVLYLRPDGEPGIDLALAQASTWVREVVLPRRKEGAVAETVRRARLLARVLAGVPMQAVEIESREFGIAIERACRELEPDVVQLELTVTARSAPDGAAGHGAATVLVAHDVGAATAAEVRAASTGVERLVRALDAAAWRRFERRALARVGSVVTLTERDAEILRGTAPRQAFSVIPLVAAPRARPLDPVGTTTPPRILFVGGFGHPPNVDAARRLANAVAPRLRERFPDVEFVLVGASPPPEVVALRRPGLNVVGDVPSVEPYLDEAAVVVAPLRIGGGMRVKVLDALAAGKAIVASPRAAAGLDVVNGEHLLIADRDDEFVAAVSRLLADPDQRRALAMGALRYVAAHPGVDQQVRSYDDLYRGLVDRQKDR
jgi:polysaccharide biosynthesis protein PslH